MPTPIKSTTPEQQARWREARRAVGARIRELRTEVGLTQEALAIESGVHRNMLIHVEHGTRAIAYDRLFDLASALGVEVQDLFPAGFVY